MMARLRLSQGNEGGRHLSSGKGEQGRARGGPASGAAELKTVRGLGLSQETEGAKTREGDESRMDKGECERELRFWVLENN